jgi:hypothetical protein
MRNLTASHPALNYLDLVLRSRIAAARAGDDGEDRDLGASAVEWVVITMIVLVLVGIAAAIIIPDITTKAGQIGTCINNAGSSTKCAS